MFYVFNNHFDHRSPESRKTSALALVEGIRGREPPVPFVVVGDFNEPEHGEAIRFLTGRSPLLIDGSTAIEPTLPLVDTFRRRHPTALDATTSGGFTGRRKGPRVDYIFVSPDDEVLEAEIVYFNRDGQYPSDHYPISAYVTLSVNTAL